MDAHDPSDDELLRQANELFIDTDEIRQSVEDRHLQFWRERAGSAVDRMLHDPKEAERLLSDSRGEVRGAALTILMHQFKNLADPVQTSKCREMAENDPDDETRSLAIVLLAQRFENSSHIEIGRLLSGYVRDGALSDTIRIAAYSGLVTLCGNIDEELELLTGDFSLENINWEYVDRFATDN